MGTGRSCCIGGYKRELLPPTYLICHQRTRITNGVSDSQQDKLVTNTKALEELPNIAQTLDVIRHKKELTWKIDALNKELGKLENTHVVYKMRAWIKKLDTLQIQVLPEMGL